MLTRRDRPTAASSASTVGCAGMDRYVAFLRGMNLGSRRIKNDELRAEFEQLGFEDVATFRASGNVIFGRGGGRARLR